METKKEPITVTAVINAAIEKVWNLWTSPEHITQWNHASDDWHTTHVTNDLRPGRKFLSHMAAKDGSMGFDFEGVYDQVIAHEFISYSLADGRKIAITFSTDHHQTHVTETFDPEGTHAIELQREGWQAILNNFKKYVESSTLEKLHFEIDIAAPVDKVYTTMLDEHHYKTWTAVFNSSSHFKGSWQKGSKILFIGVDEKGNEGGMVSRIKENIPNSFVSIEHLGVLQNGKEITRGKEVEGWAGSLENYTFVQQGNKTVLSVDLDSNIEFKSYFTETYPKALTQLKAICEA